MKKLFLISFSLATLLLSISFGTAFAEKNSSNTSQNDSDNQMESHMESEFMQERMASRSALKNEKLQETKLNVCEKRAGQIVKRSQQIAQRVDTQFSNFTSIEKKVEDFYNNKLVPKSITVANYDSLIADIETKKAKVAADLQVAKDDAKNFDCKANDPKGQLNNFKDDIKTVIIDLKNYRFSIRNLIVAVKTAFDSSANATSSAGKD